MKQEPVEINEIIGGIARAVMTRSPYGVRATAGKIRSASSASRQKRLAAARQAMAIDRERMRAKGTLGKGSGSGIGNIIGHAGSQASAAIAGFVAPRAGVQAAVQATKETMRRRGLRGTENIKLVDRTIKPKLRGARGQDRPMGLKPFADKERQSKMTASIKKAAGMDISGSGGAGRIAPSTGPGDFGGRGRASAALYQAARRKKREAGRAKAKEMSTGTYRTPAGAMMSTESFAPLENMKSRLNETQTGNTRNVFASTQTSSLSSGQSVSKPQTKPYKTPEEIAALPSEERPEARRITHQYITTKLKARGVKLAAAGRLEPDHDFERNSGGLRIDDQGRIYMSQYDSFEQMKQQIGRHKRGEINLTTAGGDENFFGDLQRLVDPNKAPQTDAAGEVVNVDNLRKRNADRANKAKELMTKKSGEFTSQQNKLQQQRDAVKKKMSQPKTTVSPEEQQRRERQRTTMSDAAKREAERRRNRGEKKSIFPNLSPKAPENQPMM